MGKTYHAEPDKANEHGYSSDYTWITVEMEKSLDVREETSVLDALAEKKTDR